MFPELNHIIVAFDCSENSKKAIEWGASLKRSFPEATLTVVHVFKEKVAQKAAGNPPVQGFANDGFYIDPTQSHYVRDIGQNSMDHSNNTHAVVKDSLAMARSKAQSVMGALGVEGAFEILEGNPAESICGFAKKTRGDVIIIGSSSKTGLQKFLLGSTSSRVANEAPCAVLIAK
ncbi:universal stress protein [Peribacillus glennii]|uniref:Universal stress protein n=1 Tax=Peribacillus glennii TaxID=2303991 RepID=A0A372L937_9BACI|nr:universal stress protein [Peribacillus glennii]RFU62060.1 universal stress protein [Peribacillus glennii]